MKFNSSGGVVWQNLNADGNQNLLLHSQLLLDHRNNAYLAAGTLFQMAVCKVNHDGTDGWLYLGSGNFASAIAMGPAGRVYATGLNTVQLSQPYEALPVRLELGKAGEPHVISVVGEIGRTYHVEVSENLSIWKPWISVTLTANRKDCWDPDAAGKLQRFYRLSPAN